jgi:hypothetical protein
MKTIQPSLTSEKMNEIECWILGRKAEQDQLEAEWMKQ